MKKSEDIQKNVYWSEQWECQNPDGTPMDLTDAKAYWALYKGSTQVHVYNSEDDADRFDFVDADGEASASGPIVRVNLTAAITKALTIEGACIHVLLVVDGNSNPHSLGDQLVEVVANKLSTLTPS